VAVRRRQRRVVQLRRSHGSDAGERRFAGWELAATMDKQSNWFAGMEKGFILLKRPVPAGVTLEQWCITVRG
jgi:hypothetical protein